MSRNALITAALFTFLFSWADFLFALTLTTTEDVRPVTLGLYTYIGTYVNDWSSVMATAVLASSPPSSSSSSPSATSRPARPPGPSNEAPAQISDVIASPASLATLNSGSG